ncbi:MAG: thioredoxin-like domain-containing protein [Planctomycetota bacterium]|nr:thioredoxin-like domain-containing protein [Planctomycetota bacterium]MDA1251970.1 thioredoxin-like domain-containing protein [Planctomycetota bacterium]
MRLFLLPAFALAILLGNLASPAFAQDEPAKADEKPAKEKPPEKEEEKKPEEKTPVDENGDPVENPFPQRIPAPSLDGGEAWLNTSGEISMKDLRGKVVLLDFWTYCCINCIHVLPDLKYLEKKYDKELVVIGVHSAKFDNEKDTEAIRRAIVRYEIDHPVINDSEMLVWRKFGARSWPTVVLLDPEGNYCGFLSGEGNREILDEVIGKVVKYHKAKGTLDETPVNFTLERDRVKSGPLKFPGKIHADEAGKRLFISDSNHNRIVVTSLDGKLLDVIGSGRIGAKDGSYAEAEFDHPQGMTLAGDTLYVADTENHLLRAVDLKAKTVKTLAGTGLQDRRRTQGGPLLTTPLNSPWDLEVVGETLFIAMAGPHQIWSHEIGSDRIQNYAGSGREDIRDGTLDSGALAQPSGISSDSDGKVLYVADSEGSAIRAVPVDPDAKMTTVVGTHDLPSGRSLFEFGDTDGTGDDVRLQHPLGVVYHDGKVYVADAYNHKIKVVDPKTRKAETWIGDGTAGTRLSPARLHEPAGMAVADGKLFIADTNNHRILTVPLDGDGSTVTEFSIEGLAPPETTRPSEAPVVVGEGGIAAKVQKVAPGETLTIRVKLRYPDDFKLNPEAPVRVRLAAEEQSLIAADELAKSRKATVEGDIATVEIPLTAKSGNATFSLSVGYSYCRGGKSGLCKLHTARWTVPVEIAEGGAEAISLETDLPK